MKNRVIHPSINNLHKDLFSFIQQAATIGTWEYDLEQNTLIWSQITKKIHEVEDDYTPDLKTALDFYSESESKEKITKAVNDAIVDNENYDLELEITTKKGTKKWVRAIGYPLFVDENV